MDPRRILCLVIIHLHSVTEAYEVVARSRSTAHPRPICRPDDKSVGDRLGKQICFCKEGFYFRQNRCHPCKHCKPGYEEKISCQRNQNTICKKHKYFRHQKRRCYSLFKAKKIRLYLKYCTGITKANRGSPCRNKNGCRKQIPNTSPDTNSTGLGVTKIPRLQARGTQSGNIDPLQVTSTSTYPARERTNSTRGIRYPRIGQTEKPSKSELSATRPEPSPVPMKPLELGDPTKGPQTEVSSSQPEVLPTVDNIQLVGSTATVPNETTSTPEHDLGITIGPITASVVTVVPLALVFSSVVICVLEWLKRKRIRSQPNKKATPDVEKSQPTICADSDLKYYPDMHATSFQLEKGPSAPEESSLKMFTGLYRSSKVDLDQHNLFRKCDVLTESLDTLPQNIIPEPACKETTCKPFDTVCPSPVCKETTYRPFESACSLQQSLGTSLWNHKTNSGSESPNATQMSSSLESFSHQQESQGTCPASAKTCDHDNDPTKAFEEFPDEFLLLHSGGPVVENKRGTVVNDKQPTHEVNQGKYAVKTKVQNKDKDVVVSVPLTIKRVTAADPHGPFLADTKRDSIGINQHGTVIVMSSATKSIEKGTVAGVIGSSLTSMEKENTQADSSDAVFGMSSATENIVVETVTDTSGSFLGSKKGNNNGRAIGLVSEPDGHKLLKENSLNYCDMSGDWDSELTPYCPSRCNHSTLVDSVDDWSHVEADFTTYKQHFDAPKSSSSDSFDRLESHGSDILEVDNGAAVSSLSDSYEEITALRDIHSDGTSGPEDQQEIVRDNVPIVVAASRQQDRFDQSPSQTDARKDAVTTREVDDWISINSLPLAPDVSEEILSEGHKCKTKNESSDDEEEVLLKPRRSRQRKRCSRANRMVPENEESHDVTVVHQMNNVRDAASQPFRDYRYKRSMEIINYCDNLVSETLASVLQSCSSSGRSSSPESDIFSSSETDISSSPCCSEASAIIEPFANIQNQHHLKRTNIERNVTFIEPSQDQDYSADDEDTERESRDHVTDSCPDGSVSSLRNKQNTLSHYGKDIFNRPENFYKLPFKTVGTQTRTEGLVKPMTSGAWEIEMYVTSAGGTVRRRRSKLSLTVFRDCVKEGETVCVRGKFSVDFQTILKYLGNQWVPISPLAEFVLEHRQSWNKYVMVVIPFYLRNPKDDLTVFFIQRGPMGDTECGSVPAQDLSVQQDMYYIRREDYVEVYTLHFTVFVCASGNRHSCINLISHVFTSYNKEENKAIVSLHICEPLYKEEDMIKRLQEKESLNHQALLNKVEEEVHLLQNFNSDSRLVFKADIWNKGNMGVPSGQTQRSWLIKDEDFPTTQECRLCNVIGCKCDDCTDDNITSPNYNCHKVIKWYFENTENPRPDAFEGKITILHQMDSEETERFGACREGFTPIMLNQTSDSLINTVTQMSLPKGFGELPFSMKHSMNVLQDY